MPRARVFRDQVPANRTNFSILFLPAFTLAERGQIQPPVVAALPNQINNKRKNHEKPKRRTQASKACTIVRVKQCAERLLGFLSRTVGGAVLEGEECKFIPHSIVKYLRPKHLFSDQISLVRPNSSPNKHLLRPRSFLIFALVEEPLEFPLALAERGQIQA